MRQRLQILLFSLALAAACKDEAKEGSVSDGAASALTSDISVEELISKVPPKELMITPGDYTLKAGERIALSCIGIFPYNVRRPLTTGIEWKIAPEGRARIDERGFFEALQPGPVQVTATYKGVSQDVQYTIEEATLSQILIFPENVSVTLEPIANGYMPKVIDLETYGLSTDGLLQSYTQDCTWNSEDERLSIGTQPGSFTARVEGKFRVKVECQGLEATKTIVVQYGMKVPDRIDFVGGPYTMAKGESRTFAVRVTYTDESSELLSTGLSFSGIEGVARVEGGQLLGLQVGEALFRVRFGTLEATSALQVTPARVTALRIQPDGLSLARGKSSPLQVIATFSDGTSEDVSSAASVTAEQANVFSVTGYPLQINALANGATQMRVSFGGLNAFAAVTVGDPVLERLEVEPSAIQVTAGYSVTFKVWGVFSNGSRSELTEVASATTLQLSRAEVPTGVKGRLDGKTQGQTTLSVTFIDTSGRNVSGTASVTVQPPILTSLIMDPDSASEPLGRSRDFRVRGRYSDNTEADLTATAQIMVDVTSSGYSRAATLNLLSSGRIRMQGIAVGTMALIARVDGLTATAVYTATEKVLEDLQIIRTSSYSNAAYILRGDTATFRASAIYSDQTTEDVTASGNGNTVSWTAPPAAVASLSDSSGQKLFTALAEGDAQFSVLVSGPKGSRSAVFNIGVYTPCTSPGQLAAYFCVYLGASGASCATTCQAQSRTYHPATLSYLGSAGSSDTCPWILNNLFRASMSSFNYGATSSAGVGCSIYSLSGINIGLRESVRATTEDAAAANFRRVCACQ